MEASLVISTKASEPEKVDAFMSKLIHPLSDVVIHLRELILNIDPTLGEEIFFNAPSFFYTGKMKPFKPREYKRYIVGLNLFKKDCVRLILLRGAGIPDRTGLLMGDYKDGRRLIIFKSIEEIKSKEAAFKKIIKQLLKTVDK
ncbi:MAG: DUF1801 domain-containing protein [Saprospiraceae bacterium]